MSTMPALAHPAPPTGCQLVSLDGRTLPLTRVRLVGEARAGLAQIVVEQTFDNPHAEPLGVSYRLPLPADGAVVDFAFRIGDRRIVGEVDRKAAARERFDDAVLEGRTAALLEQERSSVFTQELGNIPPGQSVVAEITVECPLAWRGHGWQWRFPTVIAPRFMGGPGQTADADRVSVEVADREVPVDVQVELRIGDALTGAPSSPSHILEVGGGTVRLPLDARLDRDVVVSWPVAAAEPGVGLDVARPEGDESAYALLSLLPPTAAAELAPVPRDLIVLLDTSGSMGGRPLDQARAFVRGLVAGLGERDRLELIAFSSSRERWSTVPRAMDARARAEALRWLEKRRAGGGTHMHDAMIEALQPLRADAQRQVVLVSDGLIGFEHQIIHAIRHALPASSRVHTIGVGSGVNRSLTGPSARAGGGVEIVVGLDEGVDESVQHLLARTGRPQVVDLRLDGDALVEAAPARLPDLFAEAPSVVQLRLRPAGGTLRLTGRTAAGPWSREIAVPPVEAGVGRRSVVTRFARERVEDLEIAHAAGESVDEQIEALGLKHRIATRLTSWIAISDEITVDPGAPTRREAVPQQLPYGMSAEGVGLRPPLRALAAQGMAVSRSLAMPMAPPPPAAELEAGEGGWGSAPEPIRAASPRAGRAQPKASKEGRGLFGLPRRRSRADKLEEAFADEVADHDAERSLGPARQQGPGTSLHAVARVVRLRDGVLVLELTLAEDVDWDPTEVSLHEDGRPGVAVAVVPPTTRVGPVSAGLAIRLAVRLPAGAGVPHRIELSVSGRRLYVRVEGR